MSVLKAQLFELERSAETLEKIVYNQLTALMRLPDREVEQYEAKILRKLARLDEIQAEIDAVIAKLKETGEYIPARPTANIYEYKPPRPPTPKYVAGRPNRTRKNQVGTAWHEFSEQLAEGETFTVNDVVAKLDKDLPACQSKIKHWKLKGYIESSTRGVYRPIKNRSQVIR